MLGMDWILRICMVCLYGDDDGDSGSGSGGFIFSIAHDPMMVMDPDNYVNFLSGDPEEWSKFHWYYIIVHVITTVSTLLSLLLLQLHAPYYYSDPNTQHLTSVNHALALQGNVASTITIVLCVSEAVTVIAYTLYASSARYQYPFVLVKDTDKATDKTQPGVEVTEVKNPVVV